MDSVTNKDLLQLLKDSVIGGIFYMDLPKEESARLDLLFIKMQSLEHLYHASNTDDELKRDIQQEYSCALGEKTCIIADNVCRVMGEEAIDVLSMPCWKIDYSRDKQQIFFRKVCPVNRPQVVIEGVGGCEQ